MNDIHYVRQCTDEKSNSYWIKVQEIHIGVSSTIENQSTQISENRNIKKKWHPSWQKKREYSTQRRMLWPRTIDENFGMNVHTKVCWKIYWCMASFKTNMIKSFVFTLTFLACMFGHSQSTSIFRRLTNQPFSFLSAQIFFTILTESHVLTVPLACNIQYTICLHYGHISVFFFFLIMA